MKINDCTPEDVHTIGGGETPPSAGRSFTTSNGVYIFWCTIIDFHIGANFILDRIRLSFDTKKA